MEACLEESPDLLSEGHHRPYADMLSWIKDMLGYRRPRKRHCSNDNLVCMFGGSAEEWEWKDNGLNMQGRNKFHVTMSAYHICQSVLPKLSSLPSHHSLTLPPSLASRFSEATAAEPPPSSSMSLRCLGEPPALQTNNIPSTKEAEIPHCSQQSLPAPGEDSSVGHDNQRESNMQGAASQVLGLTEDQRESNMQGVASQVLGLTEDQRESNMQGAASQVLGLTEDQSPCPSYFLTTVVMGQVGQLYTVKNEKYVLVKVVGKFLTVSLEAGPCNMPPCRLVWRGGQPLPLIEIPDFSFVEIDAIVSPETKKMHAVVIWQDTKPERCLQLSDDTYMFLGSQQVLCCRKSVNIFTKKLTVMFDGTSVSAEVCDAVVFIGLANATLNTLLQHNFEEYSATVYKVLEGTGSGRVLYVCTCLWVGQKPPTRSLPMVIERQELYLKVYHGLYSKFEKSVTFHLDVEASLNMSSGTATLDLKLDGSRRLLMDSCPLGFQPIRQEVRDPDRVIVHVCQKLLAILCVMIKLPDSVVLGDVLNELVTWPFSEAVCHSPLGFSDKLVHGSNSGDSAEQNFNKQQESVSSSLKASAPVAQKAGPGEEKKTSIGKQNVTATATQEKTDKAAQKTTGAAAQKTSDQSAQKVISTAAQKKTCTSAHQNSGTATQKATGTVSQSSTGTAAQKPVGKAKKKKKKGQSKMGAKDVSGTEPQWEYLSCRVLVADSCMAVVTGCEKTIIVAKEDLLVDKAPLSVKDDVASVVKRYQNISVIFTKSEEVHKYLGHTIDLVAVVAWLGKKPSFINDLVEQRLSTLKKVEACQVTSASSAVPKVVPAPLSAFRGTPAVPASPPTAPKGTSAKPCASSVTQVSQAASKKTPTSCSAPKVNLPPPAALKVTLASTTSLKVTPVSPAAPSAALSTVDASCMIMQVSKETLTLIVRSESLPGNCGTIQARHSDVYENGIPITQTKAEELRGQVWPCRLQIKEGEKRLQAPVASSREKPKTHASSGSTPSQKPCQPLNSSGLTSSMSSSQETLAFIQQYDCQPHPSSPPKMDEDELLSPNLIPTAYRLETTTIIDITV